MAPQQEQQQELRNLITPDLLQTMVDAYLPFSPTSPLDFSDVIGVVYHGKTNPEKWRSAAWPILKVLSEMRPEGYHGSRTKADADTNTGTSVDAIEASFPNLLPCLPPPSHPSFPTLALGLQLLLDQAPMHILKGPDKRWMVTYFQDLTLAYAHALQSLPAEHNPSSWKCWEDKASKDYFVAVRFWLSAPFVHHECAAEEGARYTQETREFVSRMYNVPLPSSSTKTDTGSGGDSEPDLFAFPNIIKEGPPEVDGPMDVPTGFFWLARVMDSHKPALDHFGRYAYRNRAAGRVSTAEEEDWIKKAGIYPILPDEVVRQIREDVEAGRWTPLHEELAVRE